MTDSNPSPLNLGLEFLAKLCKYVPTLLPLGSFNGFMPI